MASGDDRGSGRQIDPPLMRDRIEMQFKTDAELVDMRLREHQLGLTVGWVSRTIGVGKQ